jgi:hypothetical protein
MKIDTTHFYNTLASSVAGTRNGFVRSVNWTEEKTSFLVALLNENPEFSWMRLLMHISSKPKFFFIHPPYGANCWKNL